MEAGGRWGRATYPDQTHYMMKATVTLSQPELLELIAKALGVDAKSISLTATKEFDYRGDSCGHTISAVITVPFPFNKGIWYPPGVR